MECLRGLLDSTKKSLAKLKECFLVEGFGHSESRVRTPREVWRTFGRILVWENQIVSLAFLTQFTVYYWTFIFLWQLYVWVAACSAVLLATMVESCIEPADEVVESSSDDEPLPPTRELCLSDLRKERNPIKILKLSYEKLTLIYVESFQKIMLPGALVTLASIIVASVIRQTLSYTCLVYLNTVGFILIPGLVFSLSLLEADKEYDNEVEFALALTDEYFKILKRASETGEQSPTPPSLDTSSSNDFFDKDLPEAMPSHTAADPIVEALNKITFQSIDCSDIDSDDASSSSEDEEISLEPKKMNEANVDDNNDDSESDDLNDFEIIDAEEIADMNGQNDV